MSNEPGRISSSGDTSQTNVISKQPDSTLEELVVSSQSGKFYNSTGDTKDYTSSAGQYIPLEQTSVNSSGSGFHKPSPKTTILGDRSQTNVISKQPDRTLEELIVSSQSGKFYNSTGDTTNYPTSVGQYIKLEQTSVNSSGSGSHKPSPENTMPINISAGRKKKLQSRWQARSEDSLNRTSKEKNNEQCCDFCCLCLANFCLHLH